ncbi:MAG TPA: peptide-methionine (S)-S-oxide reductase MsrA [Nitrososphaera sp.]|nr:peptide-methionine (S)-S-oxide reductase MsrA [Nitrososphaera sp.]
MSNSSKIEVATLANGCFWCSEAVFARLRGVKSVVPGYSGGRVENPSYEQVSSGATGHAEAARIEFDPDIISYEKLLDVFWHTHDPTTLNRQGNDVGTQYRSAIFYHDEHQKEIAEKSKKGIEASGAFKDPVVTEIVPFKKFYVAEDYHKNYYDDHQDAPYCRFVIDPKIHKLFKHYGDSLKAEYQ